MYSKAMSGDRTDAASQTGPSLEASGVGFQSGANMDPPRLVGGPSSDGRGLESGYQVISEFRVSKEMVLPASINVCVSNIRLHSDFQGLRRVVHGLSLFL